MRTLRSSRSYGFTVCIFTIKVRLAFVFREIAAAFKRDGLFAFATWLSSSGSMRLPAFSSMTFALALSGLRRHLCALLAENRFPAQLDAVPFNAQDFD